jgi:hypothetical protein
MEIGRAVIAATEGANCKVGRKAPGHQLCNEFCHSLAIVLQKIPSLPTVADLLTGATTALPAVTPYTPRQPFILEIESSVLCAPTDASTQVTSGPVLMSIACTTSPFILSL